VTGAGSQCDGEDLPGDAAHQIRAWAIGILGMV
jgi:hypothetical protein